MRDDFEKALFENPDDLTTYMAFADWLMEQNDPRGEFIRLQLAIEKSTSDEERRSLRKRARELQQDHEREWLGGLAKILLGKGSEDFGYRFSRGWLASISVRELRLTTAESIARAPAAQLLRELSIRTIVREPVSKKRRPNVPSHEPYIGLFPLAKATRIRHLQQLQIGELPRDLDAESRMVGASTPIEPLVELIDRNPKLEKLVLHIPSLEWKDIGERPQLKNLRELALCGGKSYRTQAIARNKALTQLERLTLYQRLIPQRNPENLTIDHLRELIHSPHLVNLRHLSIRRMVDGDLFCKELSQSLMIKRLRSLSLVLIGITGEGVNHLLGCREFASLESIDLSNNNIPDYMIDKLQRVHPKAALSNQYAWDSTPQRLLYAQEELLEDGMEDFYEDAME